MSRAPEQAVAPAIPARAALVLLALQAASLWHVWAWWLDRLGDGSDGAWGLVAVAAAAWLLRGCRPRGVQPEALLLPALLMLAVAILAPVAPRLVVATLGAAALAASVGAVFLGRPLVPWLLGALVLALPWIATLQFYLGYPMRVASGEIAATLLRLGGLPAERVGTGLEWAGRTVFVDAPCSGVKMLWAGMLLAFLLAAVHRLDLRRTVALLAATALGLVLLNGLRAAALFYPEAGILDLPPGAHTGTGLVLFAVGAAAAAALARHLEVPTCAA